MKIGILTYHSGFNNGGFLQCYSLFKVILKLGHDVKVINYSEFNHWKKEYIILLFTRKISLLIANLKKINKYHNLQKRISKTRLILNKTKINKSRFDLIIVGSDEIWNYSNPMVTDNSAYFGIGYEVNKLISYGASFGWTDKNTILPQYLVNGLKKFSKITVRDTNSKNIILNNLNFSPEQVLDPTFLYDFSPENTYCPSNNYILIYSVGFDPATISNIKLFSKKTGLKTISVSYKNEWCDLQALTLDPFQWLGCIKNADLVITNKFHGTVFSIKYKKKFITIKEPASANKIQSLITEFGLNSRYVDLIEDGTIEKLYSDDYPNHFEELLNQKIASSMAVLNKTLSNEL